jgi:FkbM family methyltransferase
MKHELKSALYHALKNPTAEQLLFELYRVSPAPYRPLIHKVLPHPWVYGPDEVRDVTRQGVAWRLRPRNYFQWHQLFGLFDAIGILLTTLARDGGVILDVGANIGFYGVLMGRTSRHANIFCFEPHPVTSSHVREHIAMNGLDNVELVQAAVSDAPGELPLYDHGAGDEGKFSLREGGASMGTVSVPVLTLDAFVAERELQDVSLIKADVEGFEPEVLRGARETIARDLPSMCLEIPPQWSAIQDDWSWLASLGYTFYEILEDEALAGSGILRALDGSPDERMNVLAVHRPSAHALLRDLIVAP